MPFSFNSSPNATVLGALEELRAESELADTDAKRAVLLHEIGVLEDEAHNDGQAARELLSAVNALPGFNEPLERLVALIERRKSYKNLGKLLDRLVKVAETDEERARALVGFSEFKEDQDGDVGAALESLDRATLAKPDDVDAWLALERLAARTGDAALRQKALAARADLAKDPTWQSLLLLDVGRLCALAGETEGAIQAIERALATKSQATFGALEELERVGGAAKRGDLAARALEGQAALIERALETATDDEATGVPARRRSAAHVADAWLRAAEIYRAGGEADRAALLLDRVVARLPGDPVAVLARLRAAEAAGDTVTSARLAREELGRGVHGTAAAALWMRVAEAAASAGDAAAALSALESSLAEDPACIPARTLQLHLLGGGEPTALAQALEAAATQLGSESLAAQLFLLSADTWTRGAGDTSAARAALSQAAASGASLEIVARTGRMLAALSSDQSWFDESTRRLLSTNPPEPERAALWFELGRSRLLRGETAQAQEAFASLAATAGGAWLGNALRGYATPPRREDGDTAPPPRDASALEALAELSPDPELGRAFGIAAALRFQVAGLADEAIAALRKLADSDPSDAAATLALASSLRRAGNIEGAATALEACATASAEADPTVAAALRLEAGLVLWLGGLRERALTAFEAGSALAPEAGSGLLSWALRAARPNDLASRRKALSAAAASEEPAALAVERFGLEAGPGGDRAAAALALSTPHGEDRAGRALDLGRALFAGDDALARGRGLDVIAALGTEAESISRASAHFGGLASAPSAAFKEATAREWASTDSSVASAIEWLGHAVAAGNVEGEILARDALAERLGGQRGAIVAASARIVGRLSRRELDAPLLPPSGPEALLTNLDLSPPSCDPRRRSAALLGGATALDELSRAPATGLAGWNLLAAGDPAAAITAFRAYVEIHGEDIVGWEGLRAAAEVSGNKPLLAESSAALGDLVSDPGQGAELWERAATILLDELGDAANGELSLSRAIARDIGRQGAFDRLFRIVRARRDGARLLELISLRLAVAEDPAEIGKLYWERARVLRESGNSVAALEALENVTMLEPDHVGALALTGEIYIIDKRFAEAAEKLARLATLSAAPAQQRLMSGIAAVDLYENRLGQVERGLEVLVGLHRAGLATLPVRERLARAAAKTESWEHATDVLEELMVQRDTSAGRIEAARLAMVVYRDRLDSPELAAKAVEKLLEEAPDDGEALDLVLGGAFAAPFTKRLLENGRAAVVSGLVRSPLDVEGMSRLAEMARKVEDLPLRQVALGGVVALGDRSPELLAELAELDQRVARTPQIAVDDRVVEDLRDAEDRGATSDLMRALAPTLAEALGPGLTALGVGKKERVRPQDGLPVRNEVAAWVGALGLGEFELYVGGRDPDGVSAVGTEVPAIVLGENVRTPLSAAHRQALARELLGLKRGTTILRHREPLDVAAIIVAACNVAGVRVESPPYAMLAEFERSLGKEMPRRVRKLLPEFATEIARSRADPLEWVRAARSSLDRMAAISIGDVSWVLATEGGRGQAPVTAEQRLRAERLLSFVLSPAFFAVRNKLGMGVR